MLAGIIFKEVFEIINVCKFKRRFKNLGMVEIGRPEALGSSDTSHQPKSRTEAQEEGIELGLFQISIKFLI